MERLIQAIDGAVKGENVMMAFDNNEFEKYKAEAKEKWGKILCASRSEEIIASQSARARQKCASC